MTKTCEAKRLLIKFSSRNNVKIFSDGDIDGVFGTGLLLLGLNINDIEIPLKNIRFPHPLSFRKLKINNSILIELPITKGLKYVGENILVDHHKDFSEVTLYKDYEKVVQVKMDLTPSICRTIFNIFKNEFKILPQSILNIIKSIDNIDQGILLNRLDKKVFYAFQLHVQRNIDRKIIVKWIVNYEWDKINNFIEGEREKYELIEKIVKDKINSSQKMFKDIVYFTYNPKKILERVAMREAMFRLEEKYKIVISIGLKNNMAFKASIGTRNPEIDLNKIYDDLRNIDGITAGGRRNIGGVQFNPIELREVLEIFRKIFKKIL